MIPMKDVTSKKILCLVDLIKVTYSDVHIILSVNVEGKCWEWMLRVNVWVNINIEEVHDVI